MSLERRLRQVLGIGAPVLPATVPGDAGPERSSATGDPARAARLMQLRRAIRRLEVQRVPPGGGASRGPAVAAPVTAEVSLPRASGGGSTGERTALHLHHTFPPGHHLGDEAIARPAGAVLTRIQRLAALLLGPGEGAPAPAAGELLFLDLETTGLSRGAGTLAFVVGLGRFVAGHEGLEVEQLFLAEPAREEELLEHLQRHLAGARLLVTFNGRSFDVPVLRHRALICRRPLALDLPHLDLLHLSRRLLRGRLTDCRLKTIERGILGFRREGDVEGALAPLIYAEYLRTGRRDALDGVLEHNRLDVASLAALLDLLARHLLDPLTWAEDGEELLAAGLLHLARGDPALGEACLRRSLDLPLGPARRRRLLLALGRHLRRTGRREEARGLAITPAPGAGRRRRCGGAPGLTRPGLAVDQRQVRR